MRKSVFEYWTHALAYVPTRDYRFFIGDMKRRRKSPPYWFGSVKAGDLSRVVRLIRRHGPLTIRDFEDEVLIDHAHAWVSRKPSKLALQVAFFGGILTVAGGTECQDLRAPDRHFGWKQRPSPRANGNSGLYADAGTARASGGQRRVDSSPGDTPKARDESAGRARGARVELGWHVVRSDPVVHGSQAPKVIDQPLDHVRRGDGVRHDALASQRREQRGLGVADGPDHRRTENPTGPVRRREASLDLPTEDGDLLDRMTKACLGPLDHRQPHRRIVPRPKPAGKSRPWRNWTMTPGAAAVRLPAEQEGRMPDLRQSQGAVACAAPDRSPRSRSSP